MGLMLLQPHLDKVIFFSLPLKFKILIQLLLLEIFKMLKIKILWFFLKYFLWSIMFFTIKNSFPPLKMHYCNADFKILKAEHSSFFFPVVWIKYHILGHSTLTYSLCPILHEGLSSFCVPPLAKTAAVL